MPNKLGKKNGQLGESLPFALAVSNNQIAQSNVPQPEIRRASACAPGAKNPIVFENTPKDDTPKHAEAKADNTLKSW